MTSRQLCAATRNLATSNRTLVTRGAVTQRLFNIAAVATTTRGRYQSASLAAAPVGSANMTFVVVFNPITKIAMTQYVFACGNTVSGFGLRYSSNVGATVAYNNYIVNGVGTLREAGSLSVNMDTQWNKLQVSHCTYDGTTLQSYLNAAAATTVTTSGYTPRASATAMAMGALPGGTAPMIYGNGIVCLQVYEANVANQTQITNHVTAIQNALKADLPVPAFAGGTVTYQWDARSATANSWIDSVAGIVLPVANAGEPPEIQDIPPTF